jgi:hypothetical protein
MLLLIEVEGGQASGEYVGNAIHQVFIGHLRQRPAGKCNECLTSAPAQPVEKGGLLFLQLSLPTGTALGKFAVGFSVISRRASASSSTAARRACRSFSNTLSA